MGAEIRMHDHISIAADKCNKNRLAENVNSGLTYQVHVGGSILLSSVNLALMNHHQVI